LDHNVKQYIVIRKDLKMRRGKEIAQGSHASGAWLAARIARMVRDNGLFKPRDYFTTDEMAWLRDHFTKICLQVDTEQELRDLQKACLVRGIEAHLIEDEGVTEFHGQTTVTALAIGPIDAEKARPVTGKLKLY
jgi:PTH2 family peptidyl-tRNA hydrolase